MLCGRAPEDHRPHAAVSDGQGFGPQLGRVTIPKPQVRRSGRREGRKQRGAAEELSSSHQTLEIQTQAELQAAWIAGARNLTEVRGAQNRSDAEPGEVMRRVIKLRAELHPDALGYPEVLLQ